MILVHVEDERLRLLGWLSKADPSTNHNAATKKKELGLESGSLRQMNSEIGLRQPGLSGSTAFVSSEILTCHYHDDVWLTVNTKLGVERRSFGTNAQL